MRPLSAIIAPLVEQRVVATNPYVSIVIVEDHAIPTLKKPIHLSALPFQGWETVDPDEPQLPFLRAIEFPLETMVHLPSPVQSFVDTLTRRIRFSLVNAPYRGADLFTFLTATGRLDRAKVSLTQIIAPPGEFGTLPPHISFLDGSISNADSIVFFDGIIDQVVAVGNEIQCVAKNELPEVPWKLVPDDANDPRDRGLRLPLPLGQSALIRCVNLLGGATTTLEQRLRIGDTAPVLVDATDFPTSGTAMFAAEAISWTGITDNTLTGVTRDALGTNQADHVIGTVIFEASDITIGVASQEISAVTQLFIISTTTNSTIEVPKLLYSVDYTDEVTAPGSSGDPITTIDMTASQVSSLLHSVHAEATVIQQAVYNDAVQEAQIANSEAVDFADSVLFDQATGATGTWANPTTAPVWTYVKNGVLQQGLRSSFPTGLATGANPLPDSSLNGLVTARFNFQVNVTSIGTPITLGLTVTGAEGVLVGFIDGSIVASVDINTTGVRTVTGQLYAAVSGKNVADIEDVIINLVKSEVSTAGNPAIVFEVDSVTLAFVWLDDIETVTEKHRSDTLTNRTRSGAWSTDWSPLSTTVGGTMQQITASFADPQRMVEAEFVTDPLAGGGGENAELTALKFHFHSEFCELQSGINISTQSCNLEWNQFSSDWSGLLDTVPGNTAHSYSNLGGPVCEDQDTTFDLDLAAGATSADLIGKSLAVRNTGGGFLDDISMKLLEFEFELTWNQKKSLTAPITQVLDAQIQSAAGGIGLEFYAVCDGPLAPDLTYRAAGNGNLMDHPSDLILYWLKVIGGFPSNQVDDSGSGTFFDAITNLVGYEWGFDARNLGPDWRTILLQMGYEARANVCRPSGLKQVGAPSPSNSGLWQMQTALATLAFPAPTVTIDSVAEVRALHKDDSEILTRFIVHSGFDPRFESNDNRAFRSTLTTDETDPAVIAREEAVGRKDAEPMFLLCSTVAGGPGVADWLAYQEQELGRFGRVFTTRVDHWQGYELELGDMVTLVVDNGLSSESVKCRVIEVQPGIGIQVRFVEVL